MSRNLVFLSIFLLSGNLSAQVLPKITRDSLKKDTLDQVIISASRVSEKILQSPVSIEKVSGRDLLSTGSVSFFDALENVKGVQMITPSLGFKVINTRGFANPTNVRFVQLVDGIDNQAPHIGGPIGNALGPNDLDIQSVEIIPGMASALYGLNAINGLANLLTKNPFDYSGISFIQKTGVNRVGESSGKLFTETSFRLANPFSKKIAIKLTGTFTRGNDFTANNTNDLNPAINATSGLSGVNPTYDAVNGYGNESSNRRTLNLGGKNYVVARTGYFENEVADYSLQNLKGDGSFHYHIRPLTELTYTYRFALLNNIYQRSNRFRLQDYFLGQQVLSFKSQVLQFRGYQTTENTGRSYNLRSMAENLDRSFKSDDTWFNDFTRSFTEATAAGKNIAGAMESARQAADPGDLNRVVLLLIKS